MKGYENATGILEFVTSAVVGFCLTQCVFFWSFQHPKSLAIDDPCLNEFVYWNELKNVTIV